MGSRQIRGAERGPEPIGQFCKVTVGDESVLERLLLLIGEGEKRRLPESAGLDTARHGEVRGQSRLAFR